MWTPSTKQKCTQFYNFTKIMYTKKSNISKVTKIKLLLYDAIHHLECNTTVRNK